MTEWNPSNPFDLGVWENLGVPPPLPGTYPEGYSLPKLPIPPTLDLYWENLSPLCIPPLLTGTSPESYILSSKAAYPPTLDLCKSPEAKKARISFKSRFGSPTKSISSSAVRGWVKVQCVGNSRTLFDLIVRAAPLIYVIGMTQFNLD